MGGYYGRLLKLAMYYVESKHQPTVQNQGSKLDLYNYNYVPFCVNNTMKLQTYKTGREWMTFACWGVQVLVESAGGFAWNVATNQESFAPVVSS